jgi:hypothetical protein
VAENWAEEQALRVAKEVHRLRGTRSAQWLANRTAELGYEVTRSVIADLENGRRKYVTTAELMVLARALNTTPIALLYPGPYGSNVAMLPFMESTEYGALQWFSGGIDMPEDAVCDDPAEYLDNLQRVKTAREVWRLDQQKLELMKRLTGKMDKERWDYLRAIADVQREIDKLMGVARPLRLIANADVQRAIDDLLGGTDGG